jgi:DNA invertase Pin-like site-specific DNA recombinase
MSNLIPPPATLPPGAIVWAYLRDSGGDAQEQSVSQQEAALRDYCQTHGLALVKIFKDIAKSGTSVKKRIAFNELFEEAKERKSRPDGLLLWSFSRFARNRKDSRFFKSQLLYWNIVIHSVTDPIAQGPAGELQEDISDWLDEEKSRRTSQDVKRALEANVKAGYSSGGFPPRGYKAEPHIVGKKRNGLNRVLSKWVPDPLLFPLVKLAWTLRAQGKNYTEITAATEGKIYTSKNSWVTFFKNKTYLGIGLCGDNEFPDHHEPATTWELWQAVRDIESAGPRHGKSGQLAHPRRLARPSLLSGLAVCSFCGSSMIYHRDRTSTSYICGKRDRSKFVNLCPDAHRVNGRKADLQILDVVLNQILAPAFVEDLIDDIQTQMQSTDSLDAEITQAMNGLTMADRSIHRLVRLAQQTGEIDEITKELKERKAEQSILKDKVSRLQAERNIQAPEITPQALGLILKAWHDKITQAQQSGDILTAKRFISHFVEKIELDNTQAKIYYSFPDLVTADNIEPLWGHSFYRRVTRTLIREWR